MSCSIAKGDLVDAEPNDVWRLLGDENHPDDPRLNSQYGLMRIDAFRGWALYDPEAQWATSGGATIAVIDTGIDLAHPEFAGRIVECEQWVTGLGIGAPGCQDTGGSGASQTGRAAVEYADSKGVLQIAIAGTELVDDATGFTPEYGHGRINVHNSLAYAFELLEELEGE